MATGRRSFLLPRGLKIGSSKQQDEKPTYDMSATSIAPLLHLANYPQVPNAFSNAGLDLKELVLYIVQIPERLDFLLTLHKPQGQFISSVDVQQSLYLVTFDAEKPVRSKVARKPVAGAHLIKAGNAVLTFHRRRGFAVDHEPIGQASVHSSYFESDMDVQSRLKTSPNEQPRAGIELFGPGYQQFMSSTDAQRGLNFRRTLARPLQSSIDHKLASFHLNSTGADKTRDGSRSGEFEDTRNSLEDLSTSSNLEVTNNFSFDDVSKHKCVFRASSSGRKLLCTYDIPDFSFSQTAEIRTLSELRFNLPSFATFPLSRSSTMPITDSDSVRSANTAPPILFERPRERSPLVEEPSSFIPLPHYDSPKRSDEISTPLQENIDPSVTTVSPTGRRTQGMSWTSALKRRARQGSSIDMGYLRQIRSVGNGSDENGLFGGLNGGQAKLGKLIVKPKGQQMLDLVVATNLVMFFRAYKATVRELRL